MFVSGPAKEITIETTESPSDTIIMEEESSDELGKRRIMTPTIHIGNSQFTPKPVPIEVRSYLGGKKRTVIGKAPEITKRVLWSLASDTMACCPFRAYLERNEQVLDMHFLSFWTDVRAYLDTDDTAIDGFGQSLKKALAHK